MPEDHAIGRLDAQLVLRSIEAALNGEASQTPGLSQMTLEGSNAKAAIRLLRLVADEGWSVELRTESKTNINLTAKSRFSNYSLVVYRAQNGQVESLVVTRISGTDRSKFGVVIFREWDGCCNPIHRVGELEEPVPIASVSKLFLFALFELALPGLTDVSQTFPIEEHLKGLPSGTWQEIAVGTTVSVMEAVEATYSMNDNTAADHLLDLLGRTAVAEMYSSQLGPESLPFPYTREMFAYAWGEASVESDQFADHATEVGDDILAVELPSPSRVMAVPPATDAPRWYGTFEGVCELLIASWRVWMYRNV